MRNPFRYYKTSAEVIRLAVMMYIRFQLSLRQVEDLLHERRIDISDETVRAWWNHFGPMFATEIREKRSASARISPQRRWHLDEVFVRINGRTHYLWRAVDHEGEVLETFVTKKRDRKAAIKFLKRAMKRHGNPLEILTDRLRSYPAALKQIGNEARHSLIEPRIHISRSGDENGRWLDLEAPSRFKHSSPFTPQFTTTST